MTEQPVRIPAHMHTVRLCALTEQRSAQEAAAREAALQRQMDEHRAYMDRERAQFQAWLDGEARKLDVLQREYTDAGRAATQHREDALDASETFGGWCDRRGIDPTTLPPVTLPSPEQTSEIPPEVIAEASVPTPCFEDPPRHGDCHGDRCECGHHAAEAHAYADERDRVAAIQNGGDGAQAPFHRGGTDGDERG